MSFFKFFLSFSLLFTVSYAQNSSGDQKVIATLKKFYITHENIESSIKSISATLYVSKLNSLQKKYCTSDLINKAKKYRENGIDLITNDKGIDAESIKTIKIVKDLANTNTYIVSYDFLDENYPKKPVKRHVTLYVGIIKNGESIKLTSIK